MFRRILSAFSSLGIMVLVAYMYNDFVIKEYDYWFWTNEDTINSLFLFYLIPCVISFFCKQNIGKPSDLLAWIFFFLVLLPSISLSPYIANDFWDGFRAIFIVCLTNIVLFAVSLFNERKYVPSIIGLNKKIGLILIFLITTFLSILLIKNFNFNLSKVLNMSIFADAYLIRDEFRNSKSEISGIGIYSIFWLAKIFCPFFICYGLAYKLKSFFIFGMSLQILIFSVSAHKSFVFSLILICFVYYLLKRGYKFYQWIFSFFSFSIFSVLLYKILNISLLVDVILRRAVVIPGVLTNRWINYFSNNELAYFPNSFLGNFFTTKYNLAPQFVIGDYYYGNDWISANVNFAIDGYANGGYLFLLIFLFTIFFILLIINRNSSTSKERKIFCTIWCVPIFWSLIETSFISVLITHGFLILIFILIFLKDSDESNKGI